MLGNKEAKTYSAVLSEPGDHFICQNYISSIPQHANAEVASYYTNVSNSAAELQIRENRAGHGSGFQLLLFQFNYQNSLLNCGACHAMGYNYSG